MEQVCIVSVYLSSHILTYSVDILAYRVIMVGLDLDESTPILVSVLFDLNRMTSKPGLSISTDPQHLSLCA